MVPLFRCRSRPQQGYFDDDRDDAEKRPRPLIVPQLHRQAMCQHGRLAAHQGRGDFASGHPRPKRCWLGLEVPCGADRCNGPTNTTTRTRSRSRRRRKPEYEQAHAHAHERENENGYEHEGQHEHEYTMHHNANTNPIMTIEHAACFDDAEWLRLRPISYIRVMHPCCPWTLLCLDRMGATSVHDS